MMQDWFIDAKLGIFIHYGVYAVDGTAESWAFKNKQVSYKKYMSQFSRFTASKFDADAWAALFKASGAKYAILTSKHHDGVALYDTKFSDCSLTKSPNCGKDIVKEYCDALRKQDIKVGIYFTQLDWTHPDYTSSQWRPLRYWYDKTFKKSIRWQRFLEFHHNQLTEVLTNFKDVDLLWLDGDWERSQADWKFKEMKDYITEISPKTVVNSRIGSFGDYATPEQRFPTVIPPKPWEYCMTLNDSWGYRHNDPNFKSIDEIVRLFVEVISMNGNLLLDVGPKEDGTIPKEAEEVLINLGKFVDINKDAIFGSVGVVANNFNGAVTRSKNKTKYYLFEFGKPKTDIVFRGVKNIKAIKLLATKQELKYIIKGEDTYITLPKDSLKPYATVIEVELKEPTDLKPIKEDSEFPFEFAKASAQVVEDKNIIEILYKTKPRKLLFVKGLENRVTKVEINGKNVDFKLRKHEKYLFVYPTSLEDATEYKMKIYYVGKLSLFRDTGAPIIQN